LRTGLAAGVPFSRGQRDIPLYAGSVWQWSCQRRRQLKSLSGSGFVNFALVMQLASCGARAARAWRGDDTGATWRRAKISARERGTRILAKYGSIPMKRAPLRRTTRARRDAELAV
jgi:hypothetical protein